MWVFQSNLITVLFKKDFMYLFEEENRLGGRAEGEGNPGSP